MIPATAIQYMAMRLQSGVDLPLTRRTQMVRDILIRDLLPHVGFQERDVENKVFYLGYIVQRLLQVALRRRAPDDRDHFANKRLDVIYTTACLT